MTRTRILVVAAVVALAITAATAATLTKDDGYSAVVSSFSRTANERTIVVFATVGTHDSLVGVEVEERESEVLIDVRFRSTGQMRLLAERRSVEIRLRDPLGARVIVLKQGRQIVPERVGVY